MLNHYSKGLIESMVSHFVLCYQFLFLHFFLFFNFASSLANISFLYTESVFKMKEEEAVRTRRAILKDVCRQVQRTGSRLDMQDIIDLVPYRVFIPPSIPSSPSLTIAYLG